MKSELERIFVALNSELALLQSSASDYFPTWPETPLPDPPARWASQAACRLAEIVPEAPITRYPRAFVSPEIGQNGVTRK